MQSAYIHTNKKNDGATTDRCASVSSAFMKQKSPTSLTASIQTSPSQQDESFYPQPDSFTAQTTQDQRAQWCDEQQIYINGPLPENRDAQDYIEQIQATKQPLVLFGYGSLCWNPGDVAKDTLAKVVANAEICNDGTNNNSVTSVGRAIGWKRCWCQKSTDHRGVVSFPGLVCTLLSQEEVHSLTGGDNHQKCGSDDENDKGIPQDVEVCSTEGVIFRVPPEFVQDCLSELDFREKGGYARNVIDVLDSATGNIVKALLYRGTPDNPAISRRALTDPIYAAATMAVAIGPSGHNDQYLFNLESFLKKPSSTFSKQEQSQTNEVNTTNEYDNENGGDLLTRQLASLVRTFQSHHDLFFLFGCGCNQFNQLLLRQTGEQQTNDERLSAEEEMYTRLSPIVLITPKQLQSDSDEGSISYSSPKPKAIFAGASHSALLTDNGYLHLWGCNTHHQLGRSSDDNDQSSENGSESQLFTTTPPLANIKVQDVALGHNHTVIIEKDTGYLYAFGDNGRGQVLGTTSSSPIVKQPTIPPFAINQRFIKVAAGLYHSAAISEEGELFTFGWSRNGQCEKEVGEKRNVRKPVVCRWRPSDGSRLHQVICGKDHTVVLDEYGRIWTMGCNKRGQLGRNEYFGLKNVEPGLVDGFLGRKGSGCNMIDCGWSHNVASVVKKGSSSSHVNVYGWGRNDMSQLLSCREEKCISQIRIIFEDLFAVEGIQKVCCGPESCHVIDSNGKYWGQGWNEHGNLSTGDKENSTKMTELIGEKVISPYLFTKDKTSHEALMAAGGAHFLTMIR